MRNFFFAFLLLFTASADAQSLNLDNPGDYVTAISNAQVEMNQKYMAYMSASAHSRRARKIEKMRVQALESINNSKYKTIELPLYKGDNSLRQSSIDYIQMCYRVFNEDYSKIVNMEEIAEQSFDEMQAFILLKEKTSEVLHEAAAKMHKAVQDFAVKYNVRIINENDDLGEKMDVAGKLNHYYNKVFMIYFKCSWEDNELVKAINAKKIKEAEQARNALISYATEGLTGLDTLKNFEGDGSLYAACKTSLQFYKKTAENDYPKMTDMFLKQENFDKIKKNFEKISSSDRKQEDIDTYNKGVKDNNAAIELYNQTNNRVNTARTAMLEEWEKAVHAFFDEHMPRYK